MTGGITVKETAQTGLGGGALTFPWWGETVAVLLGANQFLLAIGGLIVVGFTAYNLYLRNKILREELKKSKQQ